MTNGPKETLPPVGVAMPLHDKTRRVYVGAYGFEERCLGWLNQNPRDHNVAAAAMIRYVHPKGRNRISQARRALQEAQVPSIKEIKYTVPIPHALEDEIARVIDPLLPGIEEVVVDVSGMTKLAILAVLLHILRKPIPCRIAYSEAADYTPTADEYQESRQDMGFVARFPSRGVSTVVRLKSLSSIRMQGQPVVLVAFTSFNEQLVRHMLGTISPYRLVFINGRPPRAELAWRERATQEIHQRLILQYPEDNELDHNGLLKRVASTLDYRETVAAIENVYTTYGSHNRIICAATGSKMQTVGLAVAKVLHPDIHIEYPNPDSYFVHEAGDRVRAVHEVSWIQDDPTACERVPIEAPFSRK